MTQSPCGSSFLEVAQRENAAFPLELNQSAQSLSAARSNEVARFGRDPSFAQTPHARARQARRLVCRMCLSNIALQGSCLLRLFQTRFAVPAFGSRQEKSKKKK